MRQARKVFFNNHVRVTPGCWFWEGSINQQGYGRIPLLGSLSGLYETAHKMSYELYVGSIPKGMILRHTCDIRHCVNPAHLILGTHKDNAQDAVSRGRNSKGESHGKTLTTQKEVLQIRDLARCGLFSVRIIAKYYGLNQSVVSDIKVGRTWAHL